MSSSLGPVELVCDAPPYGVVSACESVGFLTPLDVGWRRLAARAQGQEGGLHPLRWLFGTSPPVTRACMCGWPLPPPDRYAFIYNSGPVQHYLLCQCLRCRTIHWEECHG
jgi:hypothetical protein